MTEDYDDEEELPEMLMLLMLAWTTLQNRDLPDLVFEGTFYV